jgi:hypothetical protein
MKGYSTPRSARFAPDKAIDRGEFITVVWRVLSIGTTNTNQVYSYFAPTRFADVPASSSYARFVNQLDTLGMLEWLITKWSDGSLYLKPNQEITQTEVKNIMVEVLKRRWYDSNPIQTFPDGDNSVKRGEVAFLMTEVIRWDPNVVLGNNHKFLQVMANRLQTLDIPARRNLISRFLDKINTVSPDRMFSIGLYPKGLTRDLTDALNGTITAKNPTLLPIYNTSWWSNDPLEQLLNEWSQ